MAAEKATRGASLQPPGALAIVLGIHLICARAGLPSAYAAVADTNRLGEFTMELQWQTSEAASCFHAVEAVYHGQTLRDGDLGDAMRTPVAALRRTIEFDQPRPDVFFQHLVPMAMSTPSASELAHRLLTKCQGMNRSGGMDATYVAHFQELRSVFQAALPRLDAQSPVDATRLREAWTLEGSRLRESLSRLGEPELLPPGAQVVLVHPLGEGGGKAHPSYNLLRMESLAHDPRPELPELLRLAWLIGQLNLDLPRYSDPLSPLRAPRVGAAALIALVLAVAQELELAPHADETLRLAVHHWLRPASGEEELVDHLRHWWEVYRDTRPPFVVALGALDKMMG